MTVSGIRLNDMDVSVRVALSMAILNVLLFLKIFLNINFSCNDTTTIIHKKRH